MEEKVMSVPEIMAIVATEGVSKSNFEVLVPLMLLAICKDEHVEAMNEFIRQFDNIDWDWYPNG